MVLWLNDSGICCEFHVFLVVIVDSLAPTGRCRWLYSRIKGQLKKPMYSCRRSVCSVVSGSIDLTGSVQEGAY